MLYVRRRERAGRGKNRTLFLSQFSSCICMIRPHPDKAGEAYHTSARARTRSPGTQPPPPSAYSQHIFSSVVLLFCPIPPPSRRFDCGASRNNDSAAVSRCRFLMAPLFWYLYQLTSLLMKRMFLHQHRRGVAIQAIPCH